MKTEEVKIKENLLYDGKILQLYCDEVMLPNGKTAKREYVNHNGGCSILAIDKDNNIYLVEQFRYPYHKNILEIPAGKLEKGEDPLDCARRELKEEIGATAESIKEIITLYPTPAYTNEPLRIYKAEGLSFGDNHLDENEFINVIKMPLKEAYRRVKSNEINDSKTVVAILTAVLEEGK